MSRNTTALEHIAPQITDMEVEHSGAVLEEKKEVDARDTAIKNEAQVVKEDAGPENDAPDPSGGPKAWLYILATFFMFISAWGLTQVFGIFKKSTLPLCFLAHHPVPYRGSAACSASSSSYLALSPARSSMPATYAPSWYTAVPSLFSEWPRSPLQLPIGTSSFHRVCSSVSAPASLTSLPSHSSPRYSHPQLAPGPSVGAKSGGSIGGIIFTFMLRRLVPTVGFPWAVRAVALVNLVLSTIGLAIILPRRPQPTGRRRALLDLRAFRELSFLLFALALSFNYVAFYIPAFYLPVIATKSLGQSQDFAFESLAFVSVGSFFGRTIPMLAATRIGSVQVYLLATLAAVVVLFSWTAIHIVTGFVVFSVVFGLISGALVSAPSAAISHPVLAPSMSVIGTRLGILWMFGSVEVLIGTPIAGAIVDVQRGYFVPGQCFAGAMVAAASLCLITPLAVVIRCNKKHQP